MTLGQNYFQDKYSVPQRKTLVTNRPPSWDRGEKAGLPSTTDNNTMWESRLTTNMLPVNCYPSRKDTSNFYQNLLFKIGTVTTSFPYAFFLFCGGDVTIFLYFTLLYFDSGLWAYIIVLNSLNKVSSNSSSALLTNVIGTVEKFNMLIKQWHVKGGKEEWFQCTAPCQGGSYYTEGHPGITNSFNSPTLEDEKWFYFSIPQYFHLHVYQRHHHPAYGVQEHFKVLQSFRYKVVLIQVNSITKIDLIHRKSIAFNHLKVSNKCQVHLF